MVNSTGRAVTMFQLGKPSVTVSIPLGSSSAITPVALSLRGRKAVVPLGNAASVALVNLETATVQRYFTFPSGNATGSAWADDTTVFVANTDTDKIGRFYVNQATAEITATATVAPSPTAVAVTGGRVLVVSGNLAKFVPIGPGVVTAINPSTMAVLGTVQTGGMNPTDVAVGPDGLLYVLNTGDYVAQSSVGIVNPATMTLVATIPNWSEFFAPNQRTPKPSPNCSSPIENLMEELGSNFSLPKMLHSTLKTSPKVTMQTGFTA